MSEYFSFYVPGYQFTPAFKQRFWNGKIYLFDLKTQKIYYGLLHYIKLFCEKNKYTYLLEDNLEPNVNLSKEDFLTFIKKLKLSLEPRDYQIDAALNAINNKRALIVSPTASGKSLILYLIFCYMLESKHKKGLLIVPTISLVEQMFSDFKQYMNNIVDLEKIIFKIYGGVDKTLIGKHKLVISTWQSIFNQPKEWFEDFDFVLGDEAHQFKAKSLTTILSNAINAEYRIGCTGTLDGTNTHKLVLEGLFGPVYQSVTTKELIDKKQLSNFKIKCLILKYPKDVCLRLRDGNYQSEMDYIVRCEARNQFIKNLVLNLKGNSLVLFQFVEKHGKDLHKKIIDSSKDRKVFFVSGATDVEVRESIRSITDFHNKNTITLSFDDYEVLIDGDEFVPLINLPQKKAKDITENDDIDTDILIHKIKASTLKGHIV